MCYGGVDSYDFHGLETIQCMVERRKGGESGVKWVQAYRGDKFWQACRDVDVDHAYVVAPVQKGWPMKATESFSVDVISPAQLPWSLAR